MYMERISNGHRGAMVGLVVLMLLALAAVPAIANDDHGGSSGQSSGAPEIVIPGQPEATHVQISRVVSPEPAWLAIRTVTDSGDPGDVVGYRKISAGETTEFEVEAELINVPGSVYKMVYASLYERNGDLGSNRDVQNQPLLEHDGEPITQLFSVCKHVYPHHH